MSLIEVNGDTLTIEPITTPAIKIADEKFEVMPVTCPAERDGALLVLKEIKRKTKDLSDQRLGITRPMDAAKTAVMDFFKRPLKLLEQAETGLKTAILNYDKAEARARAIEEARIKATLEAEAAKQREALKAEAAAALKQGDEVTARAAFQESKLVQPAPVVAIAKPIQHENGSSTRTRWLAEVVDVNQIPREYLVPDYKRLRELANVNKGQNAPAGVRFYAEETLAVRI